MRAGISACGQSRGRNEVAPEQTLQNVGLQEELTKRKDKKRQREI